MALCEAEGGVLSPYSTKVNRGHEKFNYFYIVIFCHI